MIWSLLGKQERDIGIVVSFDVRILAAESVLRRAEERLAEDTAHSS